jgi:hypothetical protein
MVGGTSSCAAWLWMISSQGPACLAGHTGNLPNPLTPS